MALITKTEDVSGSTHFELKIPLTKENLFFNLVTANKTTFNKKLLKTLWVLQQHFHMVIVTLWTVGENGCGTLSAKIFIKLLGQQKKQNNAFNIAKSQTYERHCTNTRYCLVHALNWNPTHTYIYIPALKTVVTI